MDANGYRSAARWQPVGLALLLGIGLWIQMGTAAEGQSQSTRRSSATSAEGAEAKAEVDTKKLEAKLDRILDNQERMFQRFDEVMEELKIVKIRATLR